ncbi:hypothetical protein [Glutamicibacter sp. V16R2B1]|uniref:hypothetical protein n=1 Tax=Glutamicibacter sp. V16R2B1 TaxID=2036207 RepID=UPI0010FE0D74|nr:hypothetical protein [Glutamicibacter sp. V16R2B1]MCK9901341.1 hypothetical protein [Frankia sp. Cpl3]TLK47807.1 hypothetical protein FDN03_15605 [Glutamicibacter sp. V16R2B1]
MSDLDEGGIWCGTCCRSTFRAAAAGGCICPRKPRRTAAALPVTDEEAAAAARADNALGLGSLHAAYVQVLTEFREGRGYWADLTETDANRAASLRVELRELEFDPVEAWLRILTADLNTHSRKAHR